MKKSIILLCFSLFFSLDLQAQNEFQGILEEYGKDPFSIAYSENYVHEISFPNFEQAVKSRQNIHILDDKFYGVFPISSSQSGLFQIDLHTNERKLIKKFDNPILLLTVPTADAPVFLLSSVSLTQSTLYIYDLNTDVLKTINMPESFIVLDASKGSSAGAYIFSIVINTYRTDAELVDISSFLYDKNVLPYYDGMDYAAKIRSKASYFSVHYYKFNIENEQLSLIFPQPFTVTIKKDESTNDWYEYIDSETYIYEKRKSIYEYNDNEFIVHRSDYFVENKIQYFLAVPSIYKLPITPKNIREPYFQPTEGSLSIYSYLKGKRSRQLLNYNRTTKCLLMLVGKELVELDLENETYNILVYDIEIKTEDDIFYSNQKDHFWLVTKNSNEFVVELFNTEEKSLKKVIINN